MKRINCLLMLFFSISNIQILIAENQWMNIFVHGVVALKANLTPGLLVRLVSDDIECTQYAKNVLTVRENPYLFNMQPMQGLNLRRINPCVSAPSGSYVFSILYNMVNKYAYGPNIKNRFYTFGWSGLLSRKRKFEEARLLYIQLRDEVNKLKAHGHNPKVRIIAYSQGGNVSLNLSSLRQCEFQADTFNIDELILIGMPIAKTFTPLLHNPIFKKIYNIYSRADIVQHLDITETGTLSHRRFKGCLPDKLTQIELKIVGPLNKICPNQSRRQRAIDQSPGHVELWFFGWTHHSYRKDLSYYPLPAAVFSPLIIASAQKHASCSRNLKVEIRPHEEIMKVRAHETCKTQTFPFLNIHQLTKLRIKATEYHPGQPKYLPKYLELHSKLNHCLYH